MTCMALQKAPAPRQTGAGAFQSGKQAQSRPARIIAEQQLSTKQAQPTQTVTIPRIDRQRRRLKDTLSESIIVFLTISS